MKLAVIFPGVGYHCDKPLLYYSKKIAAKKGYDIREVVYDRMPEKMRGNEKKMKAAFLIAMGNAEEQLGDIDFDAYEEVIFISKSIGTVIAASLDKEYDLGVKQVYFTPVPQTFEYMKKGVGICFHGLNDPWCDNEVAQKGIDAAEIPYYTYEDANHSLETGKVKKDIKTLGKVMEIVKEYVSTAK